MPELRVAQSMLLMALALDAMQGVALQAVLQPRGQSHGTPAQPVIEKVQQTVLFCMQVFCELKCNNAVYVSKELT